MALEAGVGEDGADFAQEVYGLGGGGEGGGEEEYQEMKEHTSLVHKLSQRGAVVRHNNLYAVASVHRASNDRCIGREVLRQ